VLSGAPILPIGAPEAAELVARGLTNDGDGQDIANDNGIGEDGFHKLVKLAQHAPALSYAFELFRRGEIGLGGDDPEQVSLRGAMTDAGIPDSWHAQLAKLAVSIPTPAEIMNALLEGQITRGEAERRWKEAGGDPTWFQAAFDSGGEAPTPTQALELLNRGIIPERGAGPGVVSYEQAFLEGPWRNKWLNSFLALREYLPPPRTVTAMYHAGELTHDRAAELLRKQGLAADLVTAYLSKASSTHTATEKHLAKGEITKAYADGIMTKAEARAALVALKYSEHDADLILELVDVHTKTSQLNAATNRVRAQYESGKITDAEAEKLLGELGVDGKQAKGTVAIWRLTVSHKTRELSPGQIESARYYEIIDSKSAVALLMALGYDEFDAWVALSVRLHGPLSDYPRPASPYPAPKPVKP